jgi:eukaryotic-like serine/threonine-protein kinase
MYDYWLAGKDDFAIDREAADARRGRYRAQAMTSTVSTGTLLGERYRLTDRVAAGGQGEVWRAADTTLGRIAAVKVLRAEYADNVEFRERFRREAQHAAALSHPGIAQVFDYDEGDAGTAPYLVMEYVDGEPLSAAIAREAPLSHGRVLDIVIAAASALSAAHAAGLVHRDVKPGNVLLSRDGSVKITDFGIAQAVDASPLTRTGMLIGTPLYLAPEQAIGRPATSASDLYALGVIAFEMLTGRPPYEGPPTAVLLAHRDAPLPPLPGLGALVHALTAKDPAMRPHPAAAVADLATRLRADLAVTARDTPWPDAGAITPLDQPIPIAGPGGRTGVTQILARPAGPVGRRRPLPLLLGAAATALVVGVTGWLIRPAGHDRPVAGVQRPPASPATPATSPPTARKIPPPIKQPEPAARVTRRPRHHDEHRKHGKGGRHRH